MGLENKKTIRLAKFSGRLGNKIIQLHNLFQFGYLLGLEPKFPNDEQILNLFNYKKQEPSKEDNPVSFICSENILNWNVPQTNLVVLDPWMGEIFFEFVLPSEKFFPFKDEFVLEEDTCSIHFRGTDFNNWLEYSIHPPRYYIDSIEKLRTKYNVDKWYLCGDDHQMVGFVQTKKYLESINQKVEIGSIVDYKKDFYTMCNSKYIIASPSTFCISAGFCGIKNKIIIHNRKWVEERSKKEDLFWKNIWECGGNHNYYVQLLV